jgi:hypothetical protein
MELPVGIGFQSTVEKVELERWNNQSLQPLQSLFTDVCARWSGLRLANSSKNGANAWRKFDGRRGPV